MDFPFNKDNSINHNKAFVTSPKRLHAKGHDHIHNRQKSNKYRSAWLMPCFIHKRTCVYKRTRSIKKRKRKRFRARYVLLLCFLGIIDASRNQKTSRFFVFSFWQENENQDFSSFIRFYVLSKKRKSIFQFVYSFFGSYWAKRIYHSISGFRRWAGPLIG